MPTRHALLTWFVVLCCMTGGTLPAHASGGGGEIIVLVLGPFITTAEVGSTLYHSVGWVMTTTSTPLSLGGGAQKGFIAEHQHSLSDALALDSSGIMRDLAKVYDVPDHAYLTFLREVRRQRQPLQYSLNRDDLRPHLSGIHSTFLMARQVAMNAPRKAS